MRVISMTNYVLGLAIQRYLSFVTLARLYFYFQQLTFFYTVTYNTVNCKTFTVSSKSIIWKYFNTVESSVLEFIYFFESLIRRVITDQVDTDGSEREKNMTSQ